ncbi:hypothetical protein GQ607_016458, partial [Colletotrichum asianum]
PRAVIPFPAAAAAAAVVVVATVAAKSPPPLDICSGQDLDYDMAAGARTRGTPSPKGKSNTTSGVPAKDVNYIPPVEE